VEEVSPDILRFARPLRHPAALRVLLALEATPRGRTQLALQLDLSEDTAEYVVSMLIREGLIEQVGFEPADARERTNRRIYGSCHTGWGNVLKALSDLQIKSRES
jgi:DNA-binding transcriptional ArsR family regulator